MDISLFDYHLPPDLIAQEPIEPRDHSRLLVLDRKTGLLEHSEFNRISDYLSDRDVLVLNDSKVVPARLLGKKEPGGGKAEILLIHPQGKENFDFTVWPREWKAIGRPSLSVGQTICCGENLCATVKQKTSYELTIAFNMTGEDLRREILSLGRPPLPPYVTAPTAKSFSSYQTVYACREGSIAAPTAGFHFSENILTVLKNHGVDIQFITLHVGLGTFLPVKSQDIFQHHMHSEFFEISETVAQNLNRAKKQGKRIIAVGTTATRVLETCSKKNEIKAQKGWTNLFIYPGYEFQFADALITNFHLPKSTLLMLVSAFAGRELILQAYQKAIEKKYRFFSFGDAMFIK